MRRNARILAAAAALSAAAAWGQGATGRDIFVRPDKGNCIACHQLTRFAEAWPIATRSRA